MKSACVGVLSIIELKNARWNIEILSEIFVIVTTIERDIAIIVRRLSFRVPAIPVTF